MSEDERYEDQSKDVGDNAQEDVADSYDPEFKPLVQLDLVDVKTMEEDEDTLFETRAKAFRFDTKDNEWKERGVGMLKLLKHRTTGKTRIVMRRDKTLKVCINHLIVPDIKLLPGTGSDRSWTWSTSADISDDEPSHQLFAVRFSKTEVANLFKEHVKNLQSGVQIPIESNKEQDIPKTSSDKQ